MQFSESFLDTVLNYQLNLLNAGTEEYAKASFPYCTTVFLTQNFHVILLTAMLVTITLNILMDHKPVFV